VRKYLDICSALGQNRTGSINLRCHVLPAIAQPWAMRDYMCALRTQPWPGRSVRGPRHPRRPCSRAKDGRAQGPSAGRARYGSIDPDPAMRPCLVEVGARTPTVGHPGGRIGALGTLGPAAHSAVAVWQSLREPLTRRHTLPRKPDFALQRIGSGAVSARLAAATTRGSRTKAGARQALAGMGEAAAQPRASRAWMATTTRESGSRPPLALWSWTQARGKPYWWRPRQRAEFWRRQACLGGTGAAGAESGRAVDALQTLTAR